MVANWEKVYYNITYRLDIDGVCPAGAWQGRTPTFDTRNMPADRPFGSGTASPRHTEHPT